MSRRKDRERFLTIKQSNPDYTGFRGYASDSGPASEAVLDKVTCSSCGRARNIPSGLAIEHKDSYICATCQEAANIDENSSDVVPPETAVDSEGSDEP